MDNTITPVLPVGGADSGFGGFGGIFMIFAIVALLMFGGNGFGFGMGGNGNTNAIQADVQRGFDAQNLQAQTRDILGAVTNGTAQTIAASTANATNAINAIKDGNAALIREFGNVETALTAMNGTQQECCCNILRAVDGVNYNGALNTAAINANVTAQVQSIKDMLYQQREQAQAAKIQALELQQAMTGVLKFPMGWSYAGGYFPHLQPSTGGTTA